MFCQVIKGRFFLDECEFFFWKPAEHTRVKLTPLPNDPFSDFINANYLCDLAPNCVYVATQG